MRAILVVRLYGIGNMVLATPALGALRAGYPDARITLLATDEAAWEVVSGGTAVDSVIYLDREKTIDPALFDRLRSERFDLIVVLYPMGMVDLPLVASAAGIRYRFGYRNAVRGNLYTHPCDTDYTKGEGELNLDLACRAGGKRAAGRPFVTVEGADRERVDRLLAENNVRGDELLIALHPGSAEMKRWPKENYAALADLLTRGRRARVLLVGGPDERELCREVARLMQSTPIVAAGLLTVKQTANAVRGCDLFVGNDSGPMHLAAALATPTIGLFGPTDRVKNRPWGPRNRTIIMGGKTACAPCYKNGEIPCIYDTNRCMAEISVQDVYDRARSLLADKSAPHRHRKAGV